MASRSKGQRIKADVAGSGFLNHIPTSSIIPEKYEPVYYQVLFDLGFKDLAGDRQLIAWQISYTTVRMYQAMDQSSVYNDADRSSKREEMQQLPQLQKSLLALISALHGKRPEEPPEEQEDLQEALNRLIDARDS